MSGSLQTKLPLAAQVPSFRLQVSPPVKDLEKLSLCNAKANHMKRQSHLFLAVICCYHLWSFSENSYKLEDSSVSKKFGELVPGRVQWHPLLRQAPPGSQRSSAWAPSSTWMGSLPPPPSCLPAASCRPCTGRLPHSHPAQSHTRQNSRKRGWKYLLGADFQQKE